MIQLSVKPRHFTDKLPTAHSMSARRRFNPDKLCYRIHLSGEPTYFPDKTCLEVYSKGTARKIKTLDSKVLMTTPPLPDRLSMRQVHADG